MMLFNKLPGFVRGSPGIERVILRHLLPATAWGTLALSVALLAVRLFGIEDIRSPLSLLEIYLMGLLFLYWQCILFAAIASFIVMVMKGPAYVADAYPLPEDESMPGAHRE